MLRRQRAAIFSTVAIAGEMLPFCAIMSRVIDLLGEFADRDRGAVERQRRDDDVDAAAVGETGVDQRPRLVDAAADARHDLGADVHQVLVVAELDVGQFELAAPFDIDLASAR